MKPTILFVVLCSLVVLSGAPSYANDMYPADAVWTRPGSHFSATKIYDSKGRIITRLLPEHREIVGIDQIPAKLKNALVAVEDHRFYSHHGVDILGIGRAAIKNIMKGRVVEGGSTITQQLVKNMLLSGEKTMSRKMKEGLLALEFEQNYTKDQILEMYFNYVYFGNGVWGVQQAARTYFDKNVSELTLAECATLAGVPKSPNNFNPFADKNAAKKRRDLVLNKMAEHGYLNSRDAVVAARTPLSAAPRPQKSYFSEYIKHKLVGLFGDGVVRSGGYKVYTSLDLDLQKIAEQAVANGLKRIMTGNKASNGGSPLQAALLAIDPHTGLIRAVVGGRDFAGSPYNRAFYAKRQPGSSFKPFIYAAAIERGFTASSIWSDDPVSYDRGNGKLWEPTNFENKYFGRQSLRDALSHSNNIITIKLLDAIEIPPVADLAQRLGVKSPLASNLSLALGTSEVSLQELVYAYSAFANSGQLPSPGAILRIVNGTGNTVYHGSPTVSQALDRETAYLVTDMLRGVVDYGTGKSVRKFGFRKACAGKTGTTDDYNDAWFVGYVPDLVAGIWIGYDKPRSLGRALTGGTACAPVWAEFMLKAQKYVKMNPFVMPETMIMVEVDSLSGLLAGNNCSTRKMEIFVPGTEPAESGSVHSEPSAKPINAGRDDGNPPDGLKKQNESQ